MQVFAESVPEAALPQNATNELKQLANGFFNESSVTWQLKSFPDKADEKARALFTNGVEVEARQVREVVFGGTMVGGDFLDTHPQRTTLVPIA
jgi:hypothetical protein